MPRKHSGSEKAGTPVLQANPPSHPRRVSGEGGTIHMKIEGEGKRVTGAAAGSAWMASDPERATATR